MDTTGSHQVEVSPPVESPLVELMDVRWWSEPYGINPHVNLVKQEQPMGNFTIETSQKLTVQLAIKSKMVVLHSKLVALTRR